MLNHSFVLFVMYIVAKTNQRGKTPMKASMLVPLLMPEISQTPSLSNKRAARIS